MAIVSLVEDRPSVFTSVGLGFVFSGLALFVGFYLINRKKYLELRLKCGKMSIDEAIVRDYVKFYWKETFPKEENLIDVVVKNPHSVQIYTVLPKLPDDEKETLLGRIQSELGVLLARKLGYEEEFTLTIVENPTGGA